MTGTPLDRLSGSSYSDPRYRQGRRRRSDTVPTSEAIHLERERCRTYWTTSTRGFPVGTLLFWHRPAPADIVSFGPISLNVLQNTNALWVVDGQQRITTLFAALWSGARGQDERFEV